MELTEIYLNSLKVLDFSHQQATLNGPSSEINSQINLQSWKLIATALPEGSVLGLLFFPSLR